MNYKKNDEFEVYITDMSDDGSGIGRTDSFTWFVKDAVVGDRVLAAATKIKKNYGFARLVSILEPSSDRVEPACPAARTCGGCQLQQLSYDAQLRFKERKVLNDLRRIGGFSIDCTEPIMGMDEPLCYRNKAIYPIGRSRDGRIIAGFYAGRTHSIIECEDCLLGCSENKDVLKTVLSFMEEKKIEPYDELSGRGIVRHVMIRKGFNTGEIMICIVVNADDLKKKDELGRRLKRKIPAMKSFSLCVNKNRTNVIMGERVINVLGPGYIEDVIYERNAAVRNKNHGTELNTKSGEPMEIFCNAAENEKNCNSMTGEEGVRFRISPLSFFQVNSVQMEKLYSAALEFANLTGNENVWDLYCGVGTISLFLARHARKVYGVEIISAAIENARENAKINGIENADFFVGKAEEVLPDWYERACRQKDGAEDIDIIVVDPPRKGCDEMCLKTMVSISPKRIVYVSCDPATLARDLKYLCENGYRLERVRPCDMFPQTGHVETVCLLSKLHEAKHHVNVSVDMDELDLTAAESKATYEEIKQYVAENNDGMIQ